MHCTRPNRPPSATASDFASSVLPVPGMPSTSRCPPESSATSASRTVSGAYHGPRLPTVEEVGGHGARLTRPNRERLVAL